MDCSTPLFYKLQKVILKLIHKTFLGMLACLDKFMVMISNIDPNL